MTAHSALAAQLLRIEAARMLISQLGVMDDLRVLIASGMQTAIIGRVAGGSFTRVGQATADIVETAEGQGWIEREERNGFTSYRLTDEGRARSGADRVRRVGSGRRVGVAALLAAGTLTEGEARIAERLAADYDAATVDPDNTPALSLEGTLDIRLAPASPGGRVEGALRYLGDRDLIAAIVRVVLFREDLAEAERRADLRRGSCLPLLRVALRLIGKAVYP